MSWYRIVYNWTNSFIYLLAVVTGWSTCSGGAKVHEVLVLQMESMARVT